MEESTPYLLQYFEIIYIVIVAKIDFFAQYIFSHTKLSIPK